MKKTLSLIAIMLMAVVAYTQAANNSPLRNIKQQTYTYDFQNNNGNWPVGEGANYADGDVKDPLVAGTDNDLILLTAIQGESFNPVCIMKSDTRGITLIAWKNTSLKFNAAEGRAIKKIEVTMQAGKFDLPASTGTLAENVWEGNATEVTFGPSVGSRYIWQIAVTVADKDDDTVEPEPALFDAEAENIAAFNAIEDGKIVKLALNNARVNAYNDIFNFYYVEDASGATEFKGLGVSLKGGDLLNGFVIGKKSSSQLDFSGDHPDYLEHTLSAVESTSTDDFTITEGTLTGTPIEVAAIANAANHGRLLTISNVEIVKEGRFYYAYSGEDKVQVKDELAVLAADYEWPAKALTITGIVTFNGVRWQLAPVSQDAIVAAPAEPAIVTFDFSSPTFRENIGSSMTDTKGFVYNETFTVDAVTLQITGGSAPSRIYVDANRGQNLVTYKEYATLTFRAPEGKAITKIEFTAAGNSNIKNFTASSGAIEGMIWTGDAEGVRFAQGGTSYLANAIVTVVDKSDATTTLPAIEYTECANIAAFNALEVGTYAKVALTDAEVTAISADGYSTAWIQDATAGCWMQYTSLINSKINEGTKVNGFVYTVKRFANNNPQMKEAEGTTASEIAAEQIESFTAVEGTIAEVNVAANLNKVVKITGANFEGTSATAGTLSQGDVTINVNNGTATANQLLHKVAFDKDTKLKEVTITAILSAKSATENQLLPLTLEGIITGIAEIATDATNTVSIYSLQGVKRQQLQKGINIVNGKKILK